MFGTGQVYQVSAIYKKKSNAGTYPSASGSRGEWHGHPSLFPSDLVRNEILKCNTFKNNNYCGLVADEEASLFNLLFAMRKCVYIVANLVHLGVALFVRIAADLLCQISIVISIVTAVVIILAVKLGVRAMALLLTVVAATLSA